MVRLPLSLFGILCLVIAVVMVMRVAWLIFKPTSRLNSALPDLSKRYGGVIRSNGLFGRPSLEFPYNNYYCHLRFLNRRSSQAAQETTRLSAQWLDREMTVTINSREFPDSSRVDRWLESANSGDEAFDSRFTVYTNDPASIQRLLSGDVKWHLEQLARAAPSGGVRVVIGGGMVTISKPKYITTALQLDDFVRFSLELLDQMQLTRLEGIEFATDQSAQLVEQVVCPICSEEVTEQLVVCIRCKTPHCRDCWEYNGQCATYACRETRFLSGESRRSAV